MDEKSVFNPIYKVIIQVSDREAMNKADSYKKLQTIRKQKLIETTIGIQDEISRQASITSRYEHFDT